MNRECGCGRPRRRQGETVRQNVPFLGEVPIFTEIREGAPCNADCDFHAESRGGQGVRSNRGIVAEKSEITFSHR